MKKIQMVDLKGQYRHIKEQINGAIQNVIDETAFIDGYSFPKFFFTIFIIYVRQIKQILN